MFCCHAARQETQEKRPRVDDTIIDHGGAQHATGAPGSLIAASGLVLAASGCTWVAPESGPWAEPLERVCGRKVGSLNAKHVVASEPGPHPYKSRPGPRPQIDSARRRCCPLRLRSCHAGKGNRAPPAPAESDDEHPAHPVFARLTRSKPEGSTVDRPSEQGPSRSAQVRVGRANTARNGPSPEFERRGDAAAGRRVRCSPRLSRK